IPLIVDLDGIQNLDALVLVEAQPILWQHLIDDLPVAVDAFGEDRLLLLNERIVYVRRAQDRYASSGLPRRCLGKPAFRIVSVVDSVGEVADGADARPMGARVSLL